VVGHNHCLVAVLARDDEYQVALVGMPLLVELPAAEHREIKVRVPMKWQFSTHRLFFHSRGPDRLVIAFQKIVADSFEVPRAMGQVTEGDFVRDTVGIVLVDIDPCR